MGVAVGSLFLGRLAHLDDIDREMQIHPGKFVVAVDSDIFAVDIPDHDPALATVLRLGIEHHTGLYAFHALECGKGHNLHEFTVVLPVTLGGFHHYLQRIKGRVYTLSRHPLSLSFMHCNLFLFFLS